MLLTFAAAEVLGLPVYGLLTGTPDSVWSNNSERKKLVDKKILPKGRISVGFRSETGDIFW